MHFPAHLSKGDPLPPHPEEDVDADVDQQSDNKRQVEGHHRGVDDKVRVGDGAHQGVICDKRKIELCKSDSISQGRLKTAGVIYSHPLTLAHALHFDNDHDDSASLLFCRQTELYVAAHIHAQ